MGGEPQDSTNDVPANLDVLEGLKLSEAELANLKANESLLGIVTHLTEQKRNANNEAKTYREKIEQIEAMKKAEQEEALKKQGEYQTLYEEAQQNLSKKDEAMKKALVKGELQRLAGMHGLAKKEYLKLLDSSQVSVDLDSLSVSGAEEVFVKFKEDNPSLFTGKAVANTDTSQPKVKEAKSDKLKFYKELKAKKQKTNLEITRMFTIERDLKKEGLI